uniref:Uncharacterized protein n=1 Tax=Anguilla anguilla TaxID=7936 RepID=A0A0E9WBJ9_ANGAN
MQNQWGEGDMAESMMRYTLKTNTKKRNNKKAKRKEQYRCASKSSRKLFAVTAWILSDKFTVFKTVVGVELLCVGAESCSCT